MVCVTNYNNYDGRGTARARGFCGRISERSSVGY
jgi:hypothetical protein